MVSTSVQALGWVLSLLSWGAVIGMTLSQLWRVATLSGDKGDVIDEQALFEGLWSSCHQLPSGQIRCTELGIEIGTVSTVVVGVRALVIIAILFGSFGGIAVLLGFRCVKIGSADSKRKAALARYGGLVFLVCGVCTLASASWYMVDILSMPPLPDPRGNPMQWTSGEAVQMTLAAGILWILGSVAILLASRHKDDRHSTHFSGYKKPTQEYV